MELDLNNKLELTIKNRKPIGLQDLTLSLLSFNQQFHKFIETETQKPLDIGTELYVKEVRSGSIVVELISQSLPLAPLLWEGGSLTEWVNVVKQICYWLQGKLSKPPKDLTKQDLQQWNRIIEPIAKDHGSQMNINVSDSGKIINQFIFNSNEANAMQNQICRLIDHIDTPEDNVHRKKVMYWYQTKFDPNSETGNRAIVDDISSR